LYQITKDCISHNLQQVLSNFQAHRVSELLPAASNYGMTDLSDMWSEDEESVIRTKGNEVVVEWCRPFENRLDREQSV
jgi:predicted component of type VI protein secretion system